MHLVEGVIQLVFTYVLCLFYSIQVVLGITWRFLSKPHAGLFSKKQRPIAPQCLRQHDCGVDKYLTVNGVKLHYVENGDPSKQLMLFVHGYPEFWFSWRHQLQEFSKDYWTVAVDMRGYGESDKPKGVQPYRIENLTEDIRQLVEALGREKFILVAHDWGAVIGWSFINKHMDMLDRYIMMDAPSQRVIRKLLQSSKEQFKMSWYVFFFQMPYLPELLVRLQDYRIFDIILRKHGGKDIIEAYKYTFGKGNALTTAINYYRANMRFFANVTQKPKPQTYVPGLYLLGENDLYISKESGPLLQKDYENLDFQIVPGVDHFLQQQNPELVNRYMRDFLSKT